MTNVGVFTIVNWVDGHVHAPNDNTVVEQISDKPHYPGEASPGPPPSRRHPRQARRLLGITPVRKVGNHQRMLPIRNIGAP